MPIRNDPPPLTNSLTRPKFGAGGLAIVVCVVLVGAFLAFRVWVRIRAGKDYEGEAASLLPAETAVYLSVRGLANVWDRVESLRICQQLQEQVDLAALLMSDEDWRNHQLARDDVDYQAKTAMVRRFVRRWFGKRAAAAMFPLTGQVEPAFVVLAQTELGFEESLAELLAQWHPGLAVEERDYNGIRLLRYRGEKPSGSLAYCRFGKTVAVSLRSDSFVPLEALADRRLDRAKPCLASRADFAKGFGAVAPGDGVAAFVDGPLTFSTLERWPQLRLDEKKRRMGNFVFLRNLFEPLRRLSARLAISENPLGLTGVFRVPGDAAGARRPDSAASAGEAPNRIPAALPPKTLLCVDGSSDQLGEVVRLWTFGFPEGSEMRGEAVKWSAMIQDDFGINLEKDVLPLLRGEMGAAWTALTPGLGLPALHIALMGQIKEPEAASALLERAYANYVRRGAGGKPLNFPGLQRRDRGPGNPPFYELPTLFPGVIEIGVVSDFLALGVQSGALDRLRAGLANGNPEAGLAAAPEYALVGFRPGAAYPLMAFANLLEAKRSIDDLAERSLLWRDKIRSYVRDWQDVLEALQLLRAARITLSPAGPSRQLEIFIPLE